MRIRLEKAQGCPGYVIQAVDSEQSVLVQTDWEYPSVASSFGWSIRESQVINAGYYGQTCDHSSTDGTVVCSECGLTPTVFIREAADYLYSHIGQTADDPGYFG